MMVPNETALVVSLMRLHIDKELSMPRPRKKGRRHPNGQLCRLPDDPRAVALAQPHRRFLPPSQKLDQKAESPLGGLNLVGLLSDEAYEAGRRYAAIVARYRAVIDAPKPHASSVTDEAPGPAPELDRAEARRRKAEYDRAFAAVSEAGQRAARAVARVAVHGEACPGGGLKDLERGLAALARHFAGERRVRGVVA